MREENGTVREFLAADLYAAIPFCDESYQKKGEPLPGYPVNSENGFYNRKDSVVPGFMMRFSPSNRFSLSSRTEYDLDSEKVSYASISTDYTVSHDFKWKFGYIGRDHRIWDYLPSKFDRWNYQLSNIASFGFEHTVCDWFAWSPYVRWDVRCNEHDESGVWFDFLTDCLGFRLLVNHCSSVRRVDGSKYDSDLEVVFLIYLRALGASSVLDFVKF
jgi:hypothetical protein